MKVKKLFICLLFPLFSFVSCKNDKSYSETVKEMNTQIVTNSDYALDYPKALKIYSSDDTAIYLYASNANEAKSFAVYAIINEEVREKTLYYSFYDTASTDTHITANVKYGKKNMLDAYKDSSYYTQMYLTASFSFAPDFSSDTDISFSAYTKDDNIKLEEEVVAAEMTVLLDLSLTALSDYMNGVGLTIKSLGITNY